MMPAQEVEADIVEALPDDDGAARAQTDETPAPQPRPRQVVKAARRDEPVDAIAVCRARLAYCNERVAELRKYETEAAQLERMLAVIGVDIAAE